MQPRQFTVAEAFGLQSQAKVAGFDQPHPNTPPVDGAYLFRRDLLSDVLTWLTDPEAESLMLVGPTAVGKSSMPEQVAARLNLPFNAVTGRERLEFPDLIGQWVMSEQGMTWRDGPLTRAVRNGEIFVLDEFDYIDPGELAGFNGILQGQPLHIPETDEIVRPAPGFRVIFTGNTAGEGDDSGRYVGTRIQNMALLDRFQIIRVDFPSPDEEREIVRGRVPNIPDQYLEPMIQLAGHVRAAFSGQIEGESFSRTISTRTLIRWARLCHRYRGVTQKGHDPVSYSLDRAMGFGLDPVQREALHEVLQRCKG